MCSIFGLVKKSVAGMIGSGVGIATSKLNKGIGVVAGAATFVAADLGLDYLTSKIELDKIRKESEELAGDGEETSSADIFDDFAYDDSDAAEEGVTVETAIRTQETIEAETKKVEETQEEKPEEKKEVEEKPLSPLEEDKRRAKELDDECNKSLNSYPASKQPTRKNK